MINFTIKNMPDQLHQKLQKRAKKNHRSLNGEILFELQQSVESRAVNVKETLSDARQIRQSLSLKATQKDIKRFKETGRP